jgi:hypothetical protein
MTMQIEPVEDAGQWWVNVSMSGRPMKRRGPYTNADKAKAEAHRIIREWTPALPATTNETVMLHGRAVELNSDEGRRFSTDCCRAAEGILSDLELQQTWEISPENFAQLEKNPALIKAIRDIRKNRTRSGQAARESACGYYVKAPTAMNAIMTDSKSPVRARIEAAREIRSQALGGAGTESTAEASEKFVISINLGSDTTFKREVDINPNRFNKPSIDHEQLRPSDDPAAEDEPDAEHL